MVNRVRVPNTEQPFAQFVQFVQCIGGNLERVVVRITVTKPYFAVDRFQTALSYSCIVFTLTVICLVPAEAPRFFVSSFLRHFGINID